MCVETDQLSTLTGGVTDLLNGVFSQATAPSAVSGVTGNILHLSLGPVDLNLLGLDVHLDNCHNGPVTVDISADPCKTVFPLSTLRTSWGFGFRWFSPIGPLRFEWGFPFRTLPGEQPMIFEFTIGNDL